MTMSLRHRLSATEPHIQEGPETMATQTTADESRFGRLFRRVVFPLFLMLVTPNAAMVFLFLCSKCDGSYQKLGDYLFKNNSDVISGVYNIWMTSRVVTSFSVTVVLGFAAWGALTQLLIPGKLYQGPLSPKGNVPVYKDNGLYCYLVTMTTLLVLSFYYDVTVVYDRFDEVIATSCLFSLVFCLGLYIKGHISPSSTDSGSSGYFIFDYYWGMELYPRIGKLDIKSFTNCRFGMTAWPVLIVIFSLKSYQLHGFVDSMFVSNTLQLLYITKFFWWERGYMFTMDIMIDRAGYYICWGCLVWVPGFYTAVSQYLIHHPVHLGPALSALILLAGIISLAMNYAADWQKQIVRQTDGECQIWGKKPQIIRAHYKLDSGEEKQSILLTSGYWGLARHFNYFPELCLALFWSLPALFENVFPYSYFLFLCVLLVHRSYRDDDRCEKKYGKNWLKYRELVPYKLIPGVF